MSGPPSGGLCGALRGVDGRTWVHRLPAKPELGDDGAVALDVGAGEVIEQAAAFANQLQQTAARGVVLGMVAEMLGERGDAVAEDGDLHLRRPRVGVVATMLGDDLRLWSNCGHVTLRGGLGAVADRRAEPRGAFTMRQNRAGLSEGRREFTSNSLHADAEGAGQAGERGWSDADLLALDAEKQWPGVEGLDTHGARPDHPDTGLTKVSAVVHRRHGEQGAEPSQGGEDDDVEHAVVQLRSGCDAHTPAEIATVGD